MSAADTKVPLLSSKSENKLQQQPLHSLHTRATDDEAEDEGVNVNVCMGMRMLYM
jgi:hypothetical protein